MTLGHDDGLRVKRPSGISPASIVREGKDRPELFFLRGQVPPAKGERVLFIGTPPVTLVLEPLAGLDACPGGASRLVGSRTPHVTNQSYHGGRGAALTLVRLE